MKIFKGIFIRKNRHGSSHKHIMVSSQSQKKTISARRALCQISSAEKPREGSIDFFFVDSAIHQIEPKLLQNNELDFSNLCLISHLS